VLEAFGEDLGQVRSNSRLTQQLRRSASESRNGSWCCVTRRWREGHRRGGCSGRPDQAHARRYGLRLLGERGRTSSSKRRYLEDDLPGDAGWVGSRLLQTTRPDSPRARGSTEYDWGTPAFFASDPGIRSHPSFGRRVNPAINSETAIVGCVIVEADRELWNNARQSALPRPEPQQHIASEQANKENLLPGTAAALVPGWRMLGTKHSRQPSAASFSPAPPELASGLNVLTSRNNYSPAQQRTKGRRN